MIALFGKRKLAALLLIGLVCGLCNVYNRLFIIPLDVVGRPCSVIVAFPGHRLYYSSHFQRK